MRIAVVGGGLYGISVANKLAKEHTVDLYEKNEDILMAASGINQFRLHRGYHYPRSNETTASLLQSEKAFLDEYGEAVINSTENYYCIAKKGSLTTAEEFIHFCQRHKLHYEEAVSELLNEEKIALCIKAEENLLDPIRLKQVCWQKLRKNNVNVLLGKEILLHNLENHDYVINCTYAQLNRLIHHLPYKKREYQFELCEKPVVELPATFKNKSIVIADGPFMCLDPYGNTGLFLMGNVVHAIHQANIGLHPEIDAKYVPLLNNGIIKNPPITNFEKFIESAAEFIPEIQHAKHRGSMFTIRTVLPYMDHTDERPTIVEQINEKVINVFSGKIGTCVSAAEQVAKKINVKGATPEA